MSQQGGRRKQSRTFDESEGEVVSGRWTRDEHQRFVEALSIYGKNWKKVEEHVGTRNGAQIRSHAQKFFNRLEKEFNQQFNGLKSSEIKQIFENKLFHKYYEGDQNKKGKAESQNDIQSDEEMPQDSQQIDQSSAVKESILKGELNLQLPQLILDDPNFKDQIQEYYLKQEAFQTKLQQANNNIQPELLQEAITLKAQKDQMTILHQFQNAYSSLPQEEESKSRPAPDESFFHFIIAKYGKLLNSKKGLTISDIINQPFKQEQKETIENDQGEVQKSRKQSFTFYNDQVEDNEQKYQQLKKVRKD